MTDMTRFVNVVGLFVLLPLSVFLAAFILPSLVFAPIAAVSIALLMLYLIYRVVYALPSRQRRNFTRATPRDRLCNYVLVYLIGALAISIGL
jgi:phosphate/sulfate permease